MNVVGESWSLAVDLKRTFSSTAARRKAKSRAGEEKGFGETLAWKVILVPKCR